LDDKELKRRLRELGKKYRESVKMDPDAKERAKKKMMEKVSERN